MAQQVLMNPGPRFEEILALYLYQEVTHQEAEILFRDLHGDPDPKIPDIDVREPYPRGSSAFEQMAQRLGCAHEFPELIQAINEDNQSGYLNRKPFRESFVWLIPRLFDLAPADPKEKARYRRDVIGKAQELADVIFWAYTNPDLRQYLDGLRRPRRGWLKFWPQRRNFMKNWPELADSYPSPMTMSGYTYMRFLREEKVGLINVGLGKWQELFGQVNYEFGQVVERLKSQKPNLFHLRDLWVGHIEVQHNFDSRAFFSIFKNIDLLVAYDARGRVPQAVIQVRHGADLQAMMDCLYLAITKREPDCWHYNKRAIPGPTGTLLNGGRNRFRGRGSELAADPQKIFALMNQCI